MGVPRAHRTKGKQGSRRSHLNLKLSGLSLCSHCKKPRLSHTMCKFCGFYKGREVVNVLAKELKKKNKKTKPRGK